MIPLKEDNTSALGFINNLINDADFNKLTGSKAPSSKDAYLRGSVSNYAKDLIMTFPCMCDNAIPISTASLISKANERYIITMLEMLFASAQMHGDSGADVIASVHKNLKSNFSVDDYLDALDNYVGESKEPSKIEIAIALKEMVNELKKPVQSFPVNSFSETSVFNYEFRKRDGNVSIQEETKSSTSTTDWYYLYADYVKDVEALDRSTMNSKLVRQIDNINRTYNVEMDKAIRAAHNNVYSEKYRVAKRKADEKYADAINSIRDKAVAANDEYTLKRLELDQKLYRYNSPYINGKSIAWQPNDINKVDTTITRTELDELERKYKEGQISKQDLDMAIAKARDEREVEKHEWERQAQQRMELQSRNDLFQKRLLDVDVKKANELQPSLMIVNFNTMNTDGKIYGTSSFIAGVKSRLISVDSMDIVERIVAKNTTKINFLNFIRATTGEIKFVKDFLLSLDQAKIDAKNASKKGMAAVMWKTLENRSIKNNWNRIKRSGNDASAITVLVVSQETANTLMKYHGFDLNKIKNAQFVMDTYNLMGLIICDESVEAARFLYAGNDTWETQAYSYLEKEGKQAADYKKTINLLNKGVF